MRHLIILIVCILSFHVNGIGSAIEESDTTDQMTPFRQNRWMTSISGFITSGNTEFSGSNGTSDNYSNNFYYTLSGSYFLRDRLNLGLYAGFTRTSSEELIIRETEGFLIGPGLRYYLSKNREGSLYFQGGMFYARFYDRTALLNIPNPVDNILRGKGVGGSIGLGYSYVFKDLLILEIGFYNNFRRFQGETTNQITKNVTKENFSQYELSFRFGLGIIIGKGIHK